MSLFVSIESSQVADDEISRTQRSLDGQRGESESRMLGFAFVGLIVNGGLLVDEEKEKSSSGVSCKHDFLQGVYKQFD
jgi:hypothetical protein